VFAVEGIVTAGKTPSDNAFFDTLYIQDQTGGINLFPVAGADIRVGQKVKAVGTVDEYLGDKELRVIQYTVTNTAINPIEPTMMTTKSAMDSQNGGMLVRIEGTVTRMDAQNIYVNDGSGESRAFVDGYIGDGSGDSSKTGKWDPMIQAGDKVNIVGLASVDPVGSRLRVRNTAEIVRIKDTVPPTITITGVENDGVYNKDVYPVVTVDKGTITIALNGRSYNGEPITAEGKHTLIVNAISRDGYSSGKEVSFTIDKTDPVITVSGISDGASVQLNQKVILTWQVSDSLSGIKNSSGDLPSGSLIDTSKVGAHTLVFTATDNAGNTTTKSIIYNVNFDYILLIKPAKSDGLVVSKAGSNMPVKFQLKDSNGAYITNAEAKLYYSKITDGIVGPESKAVSTSAASDDNSFRYDETEKQYIFNFNTKALKAGIYQFRIDLGDGSTNTFKVTLK
jgi:hypothetical protein